MASSFNTSVAALEDELMTLILDGKIQARIDSHNKVIYRVYQHVFKRETLALLALTCFFLFFFFVHF